jgi:dTDP-glucose pyrophosphorylase
MHLMNSGLSRFIVVLDPGDSFTENYISSEFSNIEFVYQKDKAGFGDAVAKASELLNGEPFFLNAGDGLILDQDFLNGFVGRVARDSESNHLCLMEVADPQKYGTAECSVSGNDIEVKSVVEKTPNPPSNLALCAFYYLSWDVMKHIERRGTNIELTPAINRSILNVVPTHGYKIDRARWVSVGVSESYIDVLGRSLEYSKTHR